MHNKVICSSIISICICTTVYAGFIKPAKFPSTTADLSFTSQIQNKTDGYMPYAGLSPYQIFQLEKMEDIAYSAIEQELVNEGIDTCENCDESGNSQPQDGSTIVIAPAPELPEFPEITAPNHPAQNQHHTCLTGLNNHNHNHQYQATARVETLTFMLVKKFLLDCLSTPKNYPQTHPKDLKASPATPNADCFALHTDANVVAHTRA